MNDRKGEIRSWIAKHNKRQCDSIFPIIKIGIVDLRDIFWNIPGYSEITFIPYGRYEIFVPGKIRCLLISTKAEKGVEETIACFGV